MNKRKKVAAHKHRAHIKKMKEKRRLSPGATQAAEAKRRQPRKETEAASTEIRRRPVPVVGEATSEKAAPTKDAKPTREPKAPKKTVVAPEPASAAEASAEAAPARKPRATKPHSKAEKSEKPAETEVTEHPRARKPKIEPTQEKEG